MRERAAQPWRAARSSSSDQPCRSGTVTPARPGLAAFARILPLLSGIYNDSHVSGHQVTKRFAEGSIKKHSSLIIPASGVHPCTLSVFCLKANQAPCRSRYNSTNHTAKTPNQEYFVVYLRGWRKRLLLRDVGIKFVPYNLISSPCAQSSMTLASKI